MTTLVVKREPFPDEGLDGFVIRLCEANLVRSQRRMFEAIDSGKANIKRLSDLMDYPFAVRRLETLAGLPPSSLRSRMAERCDIEGERRVELGEHVFPVHALAIDQHMVCPLCLAEQPYQRVSWRFLHAPVCTKHACTLVDRCPECSKPISGARITVCHCKHCGADLRRFTTESVMPQVVRFAALIQKPQMLKFGTATHTEPLSPREVYGFWCLADFPKPGESVAPKRAFRALQVPITRRIEALERLAEAWTGDRLDAERLRTLLSPRWDHLRAIPSPNLLDDEMAEACRKLRIDPETIHLLVTQEEPPALLGALAAFGKRPPQLMTSDEVAAFLKVPSEALSPLIGLGRVIKAPRSDEGFDADEVLAAHGIFETMLTTDEIDQAVGFSGAAKAFEYHRLIRPWSALADRAKRYRRDELVGLFNRAFEVIQQTHGGTSLKELEKVHPDLLGLPDAKATVIALALNGGLDVLRWTSPYRLIDMKFCPDQVRLATFDR